MAKFYIQSGEVSFVVSAADSQAAALWALNRIIDQHLPIEQIEQRQMGNEMVEALLDELAGVEAYFFVSQTGFESADHEIFETSNLIEVWTSLLRAIDRLLDQIG